MSIAVIISTHGSTAENLLKTTEMILGTQDNVSWVNFLPEDNAEILKKKFIKNLENLSTTIGVLFLVDMWGGTPFNIANSIIVGKKNYDIITGVNIPMLTEIFMARNDENITFYKLINIAINNGRDAIKSTKNLVQPIHTKSLNDINNTSDVNNFNNKHMIINLARIDDRLIHGQIVTRWTKETNVSRIIVVSDEVAKDEIRKTLLTRIAPPGVTAHVVSISKAIRVFHNPKYAKDRVMLLFNNPNDVLRLIEGGVPITSVNIGGMAFQEGKIQINDAISVNKEDIDAFKKLNKIGIDLEVRKVISDSPLKIMDLIKNKINK
ncbi:PTS mannose transporter subunit IIAB [Blochmannia endosymbiont of Camponotus (Colobopsis) obliquus]|uniref:PTS mannose transporter subunit IIAB n=1 Tax=Blochmannia endosymbiont of Camponotus (Colobopsis) obliquus TaxID=1505597 RepID=UPI00061A784E|nr:PTS mannose transporter subunit IIAB [Blochmannia endosymbiont of Camponotus (Colobopsis) obliquus]AKC60600.1 PTS system mannose-specific EIIAB component [Blochmannia endosymbiont of Camponotus (Colobopsis) obliquus]